MANLRSILTGAPIIRLSSQIGMSELVLVHELFHLKQRTEGWGTFDMQISRADAERTGFDGKLIQALGSFIFDPLAHYAFYPSMRNMGIDPDGADRRTYEELLAGKSLHPIHALLSKDEHLAVVYLRVRLETDDKGLVQRMANALKGNGSGQVVSTVDKLMRQITHTDVNGDKQVELFLVCLNEILANRWSFSLLTWENLQKGKMRERKALIQVNSRY
jgi:hypothetical protein